MPAATSAQAARLAQRIKTHRDEVARLRAQVGDPEEALSAFLRSRFESQALVLDDRPAGGASASMWEDDDDPDAR